MGAEVSTIDVSAASLDAGQMERVEERCAEIVSEARPVSIGFEDASAEAEVTQGVGTNGDVLRIVSIDRLDRSACGGTARGRPRRSGRWCRSGSSRKIRGTTRVEFVCGLRALCAARRDFRLLSEISAHALDRV